MSQITVTHKTRIDFWDGFRLAWGITAFVVFLIVGNELIDKFIWSSAFDDSDAPPIRSGVKIKTDHLTGCQYLSAAFSITPRMDSAGKQICKTPGAS